MEDMEKTGVLFFKPGEMRMRRETGSMEGMETSGCGDSGLFMPFTVNRFSTQDASRKGFPKRGTPILSASSMLKALVTDAFHSAR